MHQGLFKDHGKVLDILLRFGLGGTTKQGLTQFWKAFIQG